jgi:glycosyltransferase involved in cell wall biosynthesis
MTAGHIMTFALALDRGGVERAQLRLIRGWIDAGRQITLVLGALDDDMRARIAPGVRVIVTGTASMARLGWALGRIVASERPDILFCPGNFYTGAAALARLRIGQGAPPIVGKLSNAVHRADHGAALALAHRWWLAQHGRFLDRLVAMTPATAEAASDAMRMSGRVSVIPNPPPAPLADVPTSSRPAARIVLGVGRLVAQKRWDRLIDAIAAMPDDVTLTILGEGPLREALTRQAADRGLAARIAMPGEVADPFPAMAAARVVALTSDYEGVPGVLREALSVGTPVVATNSSESIAEIIADAALGTVVDRDDASALVAALTHWLDAPRPAPVPMPGADSAARYLELFDSLC